MTHWIVSRHRSALAEAAGFGLVMVLAATLFFLFDLTGTWSRDRRIDLGELSILGIILILGLIQFCRRRIAEQEREIDRRAEAEGHARFLANHDHLTGLPNRRQLEQALDAAIAVPPDPETTHALLLLDLNGFKAINDIHGRARGDEVLGFVATRMRSVLRDGDLLARTGGDEFAVVVRDVAGIRGTAKVATAIIRALASPIEIGTEQHEVGTGIGIALVPADGSLVGELMRKAGIALFKAKHAAGSGFAFFQHEMDREARERHHLRGELSRAIADDAIVPFYQPIVDLETGNVRAFEALARWTHPTLGCIPPDRFIPLAEETGQIRALSEKLLARACADARDWPASVDLSFNVSPMLLRDRTFGLSKLAIIGASGLSLRRLELEITESAVTRDLEAARETLGALREAGLRIVLDDFGTGATSLAHLRTFRFDGIKIDRRFVDVMMREDESATIVRAIVGLAGGLGLKIVAEGIESLDQRRALHAEGCDLGQGYLFGRAVPAHEARAMLERPRLASA